MKIAFVHPDLGIGGAERLVVDAAVGLKRNGHSVTMYTSHHDPAHCFEETRDGTLPVVVKGDFLPRHLFYKFHILFSVLRGIYLALYIVFFSKIKYDVFVVDQLSVPIPFLRLTGAKILFYCHFPDKLLAKPGSSLKKLYRIPFDKLEESTTLMSDKIVVNSKFTASMFAASFPNAKLNPDVLYPCINFSKYDDQPQDAKIVSFLGQYPTIVSINRFERKKNIGLAIQAFALLKNREKYRLLVAGGYDPRVSENVEYFKELQQLAEKLGVSKLVSFLPSFTEDERAGILSEAACIAYTPENEHFGIVPVEAMYCERPVVACCSGGPVESIINNTTGILCPSDPSAWAEAFQKILSDRSFATTLGSNGKKHVTKLFSLESFSQKMERIVQDLKK